MNELAKASLECIGLVDGITALKSEVKAYKDGMAWDIKYPQKPGVPPGGYWHDHAKKQLARLEPELARLEEAYAIAEPRCRKLAAEHL